MAEEQTGEVFYSQDKKKVPANHVFEYRGIRHIGDPLKINFEDHVAAVVQKYKNIDAGLAPDGGPKRGSPVKAAVVKKDLGPANQDFKEEYRDHALERENAELKRRLAALEEMMNKPQVPAPPEDEVPTPNSASNSAAGECPKCGQSFKRLDMHLRHCLSPEEIEAQLQAQATAESAAAS